MRKIILGILILGLVSNQGYCQDNLLAVDIPSQKEKPPVQENKIIPKEEAVKRALEKGQWNTDTRPVKPVSGDPGNDLITRLKGWKIKGT